MIAEFLESFAAGLLGLFAAGGIAIWFVKKWLKGAIDSHFAQLQTRVDAESEVWKGRAIEIAKRRDLVYPEILEVTYRLKNDYRDSLKRLQDGVSDFHAGEPHKLLTAPRLGEPLYLLTENLYKYRPFLDESTFEVLHRFKRCLQNAEVIFNRMDRPDAVDLPGDSGSNASFVQRYHESKEELHDLLAELESMTDQIAKGVRAHIEAILER